MCGIFFYKGNKYNLSSLSNSIDKIKSRGPDNTTIIEKNNIVMAFHRLSIMDTSDNGNQPMTHPLDNDIILMCNGEIAVREKIRTQKEAKI